MVVYCKHNISCQHKKKSFMLLDVSQVEALLSLQIPMIHLALDMLINICDREPLSLSQPQGLMSSKLEMLYRRQTAH